MSGKREDSRSRAHSEESVNDLTECPRWYVKVRCPASAADSRAAIEMPTALLAEPAHVPVVELLLEPCDPEIEAVLERLASAEREKIKGLLSVELNGVELRLNASMRAELYAGLAAIQIGAACNCPVATEAFPTVQ
jgi:hypothetical protein